MESIFFRMVCEALQRKRTIRAVSEEREIRVGRSLVHAEL
jgi:hypothetical protein